MITEEDNPVLWSHARDATLKVKEEAISSMNMNGFRLKSAHKDYSFNLVECGVEVTFRWSTRLFSKPIREWTGDYIFYVKGTHFFIHVRGPLLLHLVC